MRKNTNFLFFCGYSFLLRILLRILLKILIKILLRVLRRIKYISTYTCNTIKKMAAKPPVEQSEANKVPSKARLIKYVSTYTSNKTLTFSWVSKLHLKLGVVVKIFKITAGR